MVIVNVKKVIVKENHGLITGKGFKFDVVADDMKFTCLINRCFNVFPDGVIKNNFPKDILSKIFDFEGCWPKDAEVYEISRIKG